MKKEKMKVALTGLKFNVNEAVSTASINLPEYSRILSVKLNNNENLLWLNFMAPTECIARQTWCKFEFTFVRCSYDEFEFEIDEHRYIATIDVGNDTFAVFYKKAE